MMILRTTPPSPFGRKVVIAASVLGLSDQIKIEPADPTNPADTLRRLIRSADPFKNAIIFCNRKREVATLHRSLVRHGFNAVALHGDMDQSARTAVTK